MDKRLRDRVAIITGGVRGIGRAVCLAFAGEGASVVVNDINAESANQVAREIQEMDANALAFEGDVRDRQRMEAMVEATVDSFGKIDILVNSAGITRDMAMCKMTRKRLG